MSRALILFSSGLDSTVNLYWALKKFSSVTALTIDYGQKAVDKEKFYTKKVCENLGVKQINLKLDWLADFSTSSLNNNGEIPTGDNIDINNMDVSMDSMKSVWVPNRNGSFINIAASVAESLDIDKVVVGFNKEEAASFKDNSKEYLNAVNSSLKLSTQNEVQVVSLTIDMDKTEIVEQGRQLEVDFDNIWTCYFDGDTQCGECESCKRYLRAVRNEK